MIKSLIPFFFQTNISSALTFVSLVVSVLSIFLLLDKINFQPKPRSVSSSVIPDFKEVIVATFMIYIDTSSLPMSHFLRTLLCSPPFLYNIFLSFCTLFISFLCLPDIYK